MGTCWAGSWDSSAWLVVRVLGPGNISGHIRMGTDLRQWQHYSVNLLGNQADVAAAATTTHYPTRSHYLDSIITSPCPILLMVNAKLGSDKYQFCKSTGLTRPGIKLLTFRL